MSKLYALMGAGLLGICASACAPSGPHIHVASATAADLAAVESEDSVWYEFREGDEVPFQFLVFGDAISSGQPTKLIARKHFWIVLNKQGPLQFSYDGSSVSTDEMEFLLTVVPDSNGKAQVVWLNHLGTGSPEDALKTLMGPEKPSPADPATPSEPAGEAETVSSLD